MKKFLLGIFTLILLVCAYLLFILFKPSVKTDGDKTAYFYIGTGDDMPAVKNNLKEQHFIKGNGFGLASKLLQYKKVRPGRYQLKKGMSLFNLVRMLKNGRQAEVKLVIIKERTKEAFAGKFGKGKKYDSEPDSLAMIGFLGNNDSLKKYGVDTNTVMAVVMPYTYTIKWNSTPSGIFKQFYAAYRKFWNDERKTLADSLHLSPLEIATLASIIDEETNRKDDKYNIASTYLNRIKKGMKLQADPTIKFALKDFALKRVTGTHLQVNSPYNTYMHTGLPPGPICTPTVETLDAVLHAPHTDYIYFVASHKFDGTSVFTSNFDDHQKYARLYQQELTRRMDSVKKAKAGQ